MERISKNQINRINHAEYSHTFYIFVSQNEDGVWDVIDGVQRLSTIFQFVGIFRDESYKLLPPLTLQRTDYLPSFAGVQWNGDSKELSFTKEQQLFFKRSRIDIIIMKKVIQTRSMSFFKG